ncbi:MAG TPA: hypothetical protein VMT12_17600, partial [Syntrophales bacterium]|nr:hypothetical protein [Syntrophales bacterium]
MMRPNAEESASASEDMNVQTEQLNGFIPDLAALVDGNTNGYVLKARPNPSVEQTCFAQRGKKL